MTFGEKLFNLRKSKGMSQEVLAEKLNTSRQAISKWENGQGYPETEKLLLIGNTFNVSIDYLLKDTSDTNVDNEQGFYVSKEMAEGFLINEKKKSRYGALGISTILSSFIPYLIFKESFEIYAISISAMVTVGIGLLIAASFMEDEYKELKKESLIFDEKFLGHLKNKYSVIRKKYIGLIITGLCCMFAGGTIILLFEKGIGTTDKITEFYLISTVLIVIGIGILVYFTSILEAYELLVKNEEYTNKLSFKLLKRIRKKKDNL
ncbi:MAG: helix-turn-helix transcriptional regulator [Clostridium sp.]